MRDHLIENRPKLLKEEDQWMLDRWSDESQHVLKLVTRSFTRVGGSIDVYRVSCSCGWRSIQFHEKENASRYLCEAPCPVQVALSIRDQNAARPSERGHWLDVMIVIDLSRDCV